MTQEEKELLIKDLCARLSYGVILDNPNPCGEHWDELISIDVSKGTVTLLYDGRTYKVEKIKPYLRTMSSMTEEETKTYKSLQDSVYSYHYEFGDIVDDVLYFDNDVSLDYLNSIHVDYRGLIEKSLAIVAPEEMYK